MIATKRKNLRVIDYSVFSHRTITDDVLDGYQKVDESIGNPMNTFNIRNPTDEEWDTYLEYINQKDKEN